jgi:copper chaperone CopZ
MLSMQFYDFLLDRLMRGAHGLMWWSLFGLLSSSCCAVQLILNIFNFGCVGFNTYLGPLRPFFLAVTITLNTRMWELAVPNLGLPSTPDHFLPSLIASTVVAVFLSLLPEITDFTNSRTTMSQAKASDGTSTEVVFSLEGLGCVACVSAVQGAIETVANGKVRSRAVSLEKKEATITLACDEVEARDTIVPEIITGIQDAGFEATLQSVQKGVVSNLVPTDASKSGPISAILAGLLSSSCCVLQLGLNLLSTLNVIHLGCAGFNKVLGPWRLHLRTLTLAWLSYQWFGNLRSSDCCKPRRRRLIFSTVLCLSLMFLPEILKWSGGTALAPPTDGAKLLKLKVNGMGCEACELHVRSVLDRSSGVIGSHADFKGGFAEVEVAENWGFDIEAIQRKLKDDGDMYQIELASKP